MEERLLARAVALRHTLHQYPELSMEETGTKNRLMDFLRGTPGLELLDRGRWFCARLRSPAPVRPPIAFRADMDALPLEEPPGLVPYGSRCPGTAHKCGHDGHSASLAALALTLDPASLTRDVYLVFQHAEETGQGGRECADFLVSEGVREVYACHNLPGLPLGAVAVPEGPAQPASTGLILRFRGRSCHASRPEDGRNPAGAIARVICSLPALADAKRWHGLTLITVIQVRVGERAFGTSPGYGELLLTLRGEREEEFRQLLEQTRSLAREEALRDGLELSCSCQDSFPATFNHATCAARVRRAAEETGIPLVRQSELFRASEDFGWYTRAIPGAIFYLGSGENCPGLHTPEYDFPDALIPVAVRLFQRLAC